MCMSFREKERKIHWIRVVLPLSHWTHSRGAEASLLITARLEASAVSSCLSPSLLDTLLSFKSVWIFQYLWLYLPNQDKAHTQFGHVYWCPVCSEFMDNSTTDNCAILVDNSTWSRWWFCWLCCCDNITMPHCNTDDKKILSQITLIKTRQFFSL